MINLIQQYILNNWDSLGIKGKRPKKLSSMQISAGQGKRYDRGRLIHLIFRDDELKPFIVAKFCRSIEYEYHLKNEHEICNILRAKYGASYPPEQIHQTIIGGKLVNFEEFIDGFSMKNLLDNFVASSDYSPENLQTMIQQHFDQASNIICHLNKYSERIDKTHIENELEILIKNFKAYYKNDDEFLELIDKETSSIFETLPKEVYRRIVDFDLISQNIICKGNEVRVIDWEFSEISTLLFLEPLRFLFYYVKELVQLSVFKENDFEKIIINLVRSNNEEWHVNLMHDFYLKSDPYKLSIEKGFLIFLIFEADLQLRVTNYQEIPRKYYKNMITKFANNLSSIEGVDIELKSGYAKRIETLRKITDKDNKITELNCTIQSKDAQIRSRDVQIQSRDVQIQSKDAQINSLEATVQEKQAQVNQLLSSMSWKLMAPIRWIHSKFVNLRSMKLTASFRWVHSKVMKLKDWKPEIPIHWKRVNNVPEIPNDQVVHLENDWQDYLELNRKISDVKRQHLSNIHPKLPNVISIDETQLVTNAKSLQFPAFEKPQVSIIIPVYNNEKLTVECLTSILNNTKGISYEIIVIDDGSAKKMQEIMSNVGNITYIKNTNNLGFLLSCNRAAEKARGEFILFLNNDVQVMEDWLIPLVETFSKFENVGAVGPKVLYPDGRLQEAGALINKDISATMIGLFDDPELQRYNYLREIVYCSGVCIIIPTKIFWELDGFDISYAPGYYEDSDLCFRLRSKGLHIYYNPNSVVVHHLSATSNNIDGSYKQQCIIRNQQKFSEKWQRQIDDSNNIRLIAFYLPQFHTIPENDRWWGKGFTEWTNVTKAQPNFEGHYQPRIPGDLGYYDLRVEEVMEQQAELAKKYGIQGFCYYYYWFAGKRLLEMPIERILKTGKTSIPFCICWANENWTRKWDGMNDKILIAQKHSDEDDRAVIRDIMRYMRHPNYIRINGKPLMLIYRISLFPNIKRTTTIWRDLCRKEGIGEIYLTMVESFEHANKTTQPENDFDAVVEFPPHDMSAPIKPPGKQLNPDFSGAVHDYREIILKYSLKEKPGKVRFRSVMPSWDNTARRQNDPHIFANATPGAYQAWLETALDLTHEQNIGDERIVFINAWNEWAEGNYLEPDRRYGHKFLEATRNALERSLLKKE